MIYLSTKHTNAAVIKINMKPTMGSTLLGVVNANSPEL